MSTADERDSLTRRGFWLEYASMAWMTVEAAVAITAGIIASSIVLIAFGLDSVVEFAAGAIVIWQLPTRPEASCAPRPLMPPCWASG